MTSLMPWLPCSKRMAWLGRSSRRGSHELVRSRGMRPQPARGRFTSTLPRGLSSASRREMKVAMIGTRGVPAAYSGFETCVEAVGKRLVARGHDVSVYCRHHLTGKAGPTYLGMRRVVLPAIRTKGLETLT